MLFEVHPLVIQSLISRCVLLGLNGLHRDRRGDM